MDGEKIVITRNGHTFECWVRENGEIVYCLDGGKPRNTKGINNNALCFYCELEIDGKKYGGLTLEPDQAATLSGEQQRIKQILAEKAEAARVFELEQILNGRTDVGYLVIEKTEHYGTFLMTARRLKEDEKPKFSEWFAESGFTRLATEIKLSHVTWSDMPNRTVDGMFAGCTNSAWILTPDEWDAYLKLDQKRADEKAAQKKAKEAERYRKQEEYEREKQQLIAQVDSWNIKSTKVMDEGGCTDEYHHELVKGGRIYRFVERNIFDFGIVINPEYEIAPGVRGGLAVYIDGVLCWENGEETRKMEDDERLCFEIVSKYGKYANSPVRM